MSDNQDGVRPEVRRAVAAVGRLGPLTVPEVRALLRAALGAAVGQGRWWASVSVHGTPQMPGRPPFRISWDEEAASASEPAAG